MLFFRSKIPFYMKAATATVIMAGLPAWPPEPPPDALFELFCWQPSCRCCGGSSCPSPPPPPCCCGCCCWPTGSRTMARMIRLKVITYTGASTALLVTKWSEINATWSAIYTTWSENNATWSAINATWSEINALRLASLGLRRPCFFLTTLIRWRCCWPDLLGHVIPAYRHEFSRYLLLILEVGILHIAPNFTISVHAIFMILNTHINFWKAGFMDRHFSAIVLDPLPNCWPM